MLRWLLALALASNMVNSAAQAECTARASSLFYVDQNDTTDVFITRRPGDICRGRFG
jgi:hypothetical protein